MSNLEKMLREVKAKNAIQKELIEFVERQLSNHPNNDNNYEDMWFESAEEDFISQYAIQNNISFAFDENMSVNIVHMGEGE